MLRLAEVLDPRFCKSGEISCSHQLWPASLPHSTNKAQGLARRIGWGTMVYQFVGGVECSGGAKEFGGLREEGWNLRSSVPALWKKVRQPSLCPVWITFWHPPNLSHTLSSSLFWTILTKKHLAQGWRDQGRLVLLGFSGRGHGRQRAITQLVGYHRHMYVGFAESHFLGQKKDPCRGTVCYVWECA